MSGTPPDTHGSPSTNTTSSPSDSQQGEYQYDPSKVAAIIFLALFLLTTMVHMAQMIRGRHWFFIPFLIGGFFEWIGYAARTVNAFETPNWDLGAYIVQDLLILLAPAFFAATVYMYLGRIIRHTEMEAISPIKVTLLTKLFVLGDFLSFMTQSTGGSILAKGNTDPDSATSAKWIIIGGLFIQLVFFGGFIICTYIFHWRVNEQSPSNVDSTVFRAWKRSLWPLYLVSGLILVRSVFRIIEYAMGQDGFILSHEIFLYIFDTTLMFLTMITLNAGHPCHLPKGDLDTASVDMEAGKGEELADARSNSNQ
ncbi:MAG: hypothetical protein M1828_001201 [Chrysothrix sp. TS-e1954]|nr:MAG: hypothetical protein M1828_001201 [Chrysothrix sp. TS-e1954]